MDEDFETMIMGALEKLGPEKFLDEVMCSFYALADSYRNGTCEFERADTFEKWGDRIGSEVYGRAIS